MSAARWLRPSPADPAAPTLTQGQARLRLIGGAVMMAFAAVAVRLIDVASPELPGEPSTANAASRDSTPERAAIVDRDGRLLATTLPAPSLYADPQQIVDAEAAARQLAAGPLDLPAGEIAQRLQQDGRFVWLARGLTPGAKQAINDMGIPGLHFQEEGQRLYPQGRTAAHVVGMTDIDGRGLRGVEHGLNSALASRQEPLRLTLDSAVQAATRAQLAAGIERYRAEAGTAILLDADSGAVRSLVSLPDYDPNRRDASPAARRNRAVADLYEPGSTFKLLTAALALEDPALAIDDYVPTSEPLQAGGFEISDYHPEERPLALPGIIMHSSNVGAARLARQVGRTAQRDLFRALGLTRPLDIALPGAAEPLLPSPWRPVNTLTAAYGHGISVTPLHVAAATAALVNGGDYIQPTLRAAAVTGPPSDARIRRDVISADTATTLRRLMRLSVAEGGAGNADARGYLVGGKTGTADKAGQQGYDNTGVITSFVGAFPMDDPAYIVLAMLDSPQALPDGPGFRTAAWNAAYVARNIVAETAPLLDVAPRKAGGDATLQAVLGGEPLPYRRQPAPAVPDPDGALTAGLAAGGNRAAF